MSGKNIVESRRECPSSVDLSAWCDGEHSRDFEKHVDNCPDCYTKVQFILSVDDAVKDASRSPDGLAENIMAVCAKTESVQRMPIRPLLNVKFVKKGAAALIMVAVLLFGFQFYNSSSGSKSSVSPGNEGESLAKIEEAESGPGVSQQSDISNNATSKTVANNNNLGGRENVPRTTDGSQGRRIKVNNNSSVFAAYDQRGQGRQPNLFPSSVHHVWVVNDLEESREILKKVLPSSCRRSLQEKGDNYLKYRLVLQDKQLQQLVDALGKHGWALVSPDLTDPAEPTKLTMIGHEIMYSVDIVSSE